MGRQLAALALTIGYVILGWNLHSADAQHCLYPFHKHVRLPGVDKRSFRECVPSGVFELKECPGGSEYDVNMQACKFPDVSGGDGGKDGAGKWNPNTVDNNVQAQGGPVVQFNPQGQFQGQQLPMQPELPLEMLQDCAIGAQCPHNPNRLQYCDLNGQQFLQCSASGWVLKDCPPGTHFVGPEGRCVDPRESEMPLSLMPTNTLNPMGRFPPFNPEPGVWTDNSGWPNGPQAGNANGFQGPWNPQPAAVPPSFPNNQFVQQPFSGQPTRVNPDPFVDSQNQQLPQGQLVLVGGNGQPTNGQVPVQPQASNSFGAIPGGQAVAPGHQQTVSGRDQQWTGQQAQMVNQASTDPRANNLWANGASNTDAFVQPSFPSPPAANFQPEVNHQNQQRWVLGGNLNNLPSSLDVRDLPLGSWVPVASQQAASFGQQPAFQWRNVNALKAVVNNRDATGPNER